MQQKLARLVKAQRSFNNLVAALIKASASASGSVDPEPEVCHRLPQLRTPAFNINLDSRETPQHVRLQSSVVQRLLSIQASLSIPQRFTRSLQVEFILPRREAALLWVVPRRTGSFAQIGCIITLSPERTPCLLIHLGHSILSPASSSSLLAWLLPLDSRAIALEPQAKKPFQEALAILSLSPGFPAARWTASARQAPATRRLKPLNPALSADSTPGAEQSSSDNRTVWVDRKFIPIVYDQRDCKLPRVSRLLRRPRGFISKPFYPGQKHSYRQEFNSVKKRQTYFSHPEGFCLRIRGWSPSASAGLSRRSLRLLDKKEYQKRIHQRPIGHSDGQCGLSGGPTVSRTGGNRQLFAPATVVAPNLIANNLPEAEQSSPDDRIGWVNRKAIPIVHDQQWRDCKLRRVSQPLRKTRNFFGTSYHCHQKPFSQSICSSAEEQQPSPVAAPVDSVPATIAIMPGDPFYNDCVAISRLSHYMVANSCSLTQAIWMTGVEMPGDEGILLHRARTLHGPSIADLSLPARSTMVDC